MKSYRNEAILILLAQMIKLEIIFTQKKYTNAVAIYIGVCMHQIQKGTRPVKIFRHVIQDQDHTTAA